MILATARPGGATAFFRLTQAAVAFLALAFIQGCAIYDAAVDERSVGTFVDDKVITSTITKEFIQDDLVKSRDVAVYSYEGRVHLVGEYESKAQIEKAVKIAKSVKGVRWVDAYLLEKAEEAPCGTWDRASLKARIKKEIIEDVDLRSPKVDVEVVQCDVVLMGLLGSPAEIERAEVLARNVEGSRKVKSFLRLPGK